MLIRCFSSLTAAFVATSLLIAGCVSAPVDIDAEQYILDGSRQWAESVATGKTEDLERIIADDFVGTDPQGRPVAR